MPLSNLEPTDTFDIVETKIDAAIDAINDHLEDSGWISAGVAISGDIIATTVQYRKIGNRVSLRGYFELDAAVVSADFSLFSLPVGYRPTTTIIFPVAINDPANTPKFGQCNVYTGTGEVIVWVATPSSSYNSHAIFLDNVEFYID
jgi:hypothetical protein